MTFIRTLKQFSARRGLPRIILSDNAKTFKAAVKAINTMLDQQEVKNHLSDPWEGEDIERMEMSPKKLMVGQAKFCYGEMHTAIVEIKAIMGAPPLNLP